MDFFFSSANVYINEPFHSPASFNVISIAGIHFAYTLVVARSGFAEQSIVNSTCIKFECIMKLPYIV